MFLSLKRLTFIITALFVMVAVSACGGETPAQTTTPTATTAPTEAPTQAPTPTPAAAALVKTANVMVQGKSVTVLTDAKGMTLYYFKPDTATTVACTAACAQNWPPLLFTGSGSPTAEGSLPGKLAVVQGPNGAQVTYNGHPLYTFVADKAPGDVNGQGKGPDKWFVVTTDITTLSAGY